MLEILQRKSCTLWRLIYNFFFNRPIGCVYMFHMVRPKEAYIPELDVIRVSPDFFENFLIEHSKKEEFISIDEVPDRIRNGKHRNKPFAVVTFDDGYDDNFIYAYPILKKLQIPFVIYVSVNLVNDHNPIWNYPLIIERMVRKNDYLKLGNGIMYSCYTEEEKNNSFNQLKQIYFSMPYRQIHNEFKRLFGTYLTKDVFPTNTLTWRQIEQLSNDPLCTIGAHTMSHCRLIMREKDALSYEMCRSKEILEQHIGKQVCHMSYPYGSMTDVSVEASAYAKKIGYITALMSGGGAVREKEKNMYCIKRVSVNEVLNVKSINERAIN